MAKMMDDVYSKIKRLKRQKISDILGIFDHSEADKIKELIERQREIYLA